MGYGHAPELILVLVIVLLVFGPGRLPDAAQGLGRGIRDFRKALSGEDETRVPSSSTRKVGQAEEPEKPN
jgi:sec-independent protein translocase protein TatA